MPPTPEQIHATIDAYVAAFAEDRGGWVACFAETATLEDPVGSPLRRGHTEIGAFWDESHGMADRLRLQRTGPIRVAGDEAAFPMQARPVLDGTEYAVDIIDTMTFDDDGLITSMRAFWDPDTMYEATG